MGYLLDRGLTNPLLVIEQFTYLLFIKQLDDIETANEANAALLGFENEEKIFGPDQQNYRWSKFKNLAPAVQFQLMQEEVFPFIKNLHPDDDASYTRFMKDATFQISAPDKLAKIIAELIQPHRERNTSKPYELRGFEVFLCCEGVA